MVLGSVAWKDMRWRSDSDKNSRCLRSIAIGRRVCPQQDFLAAAMRSAASSSDSDKNSRCLRTAGFLSSSSSDFDKNARCLRAAGYSSSSSDCFRQEFSMPARSRIFIIIGFCQDFPMPARSRIFIISVLTKIPMPARSRIFISVLRNAY